MAASFANLNWPGVIAALTALVAFFPTCRAGRSFSKTKRSWLLLGTGILALPGLSFSVFYTHLFLERSWYYEFRSWAGTEWLLVPVGIAGGLLASQCARMLTGWLLAATALFVAAPNMKPLLSPLPGSVLSDHWSGGVCLQSTGSTCGPASTATVLRALGEPVSEREIVRSAHSYGGGTEAWYLARFLRSRGFEARFVFGEGFDPNVPLPAIVGVRLGRIGHFIAVVSREGNSYRIGDPSRGPEKLTVEEFQRRYVFTGFHLSAAREPAQY